MIRRKVANVVTPTSGKTGISAFQRISWTHRDKPILVLIQFVGNEDVAVDFLQFQETNPLYSVSTISSS
jgi:hypothetical protein